MVGGICLPIENQNEKGVFVYHTISEEEHYVKDYSILADNGYALGEDGVYKIKTGVSESF